MTFYNRAVFVAALSLGIAGLGAASTPGIAAQAASGTIVGDAAIGDTAAKLFLLPATGLTIDVPADQATPTTDAVVTTPDRAADAPTALDAADPVTPSFQSLADAVAGQSALSTPSDELRCLAGAIYYESKSEPLAGQLAVAEVIINRARSGRFPRSLCGVVTQAGQFSFVHGGAIPAVNPALGQWKTAIAVAQVALGDAWESPAANAMFFHARYVTPGWDKPRVASIGNHVFYR